MSLILYDFRQIESELPSVVTTNDSYFNAETPLKDTPLVRKVLKDIDGVSYVDETYVASDRFTKLTYVLRENLSTGCKTALNVLLHPEICFSLIECGKNASRWILQQSQGKVYLPPIQLDLPEHATCDIVYKGKHFAELHELLTWDGEV